MPADAGRDWRTATGLQERCESLLHAFASFLDANDFAGALDTEDDNPAGGVCERADRTADRRQIPRPSDELNAAAFAVLNALLDRRPLHRHSPIRTLSSVVADMLGEPVSQRYIGRFGRRIAVPIAARAEQLPADRFLAVRIVLDP